MGEALSDGDCVRVVDSVGVTDPVTVSEGVRDGVGVTLPLGVTVEEADAACDCVPERVPLIVAVGE